ncbi:MAG: uroporphyrinogen decarboxylase, partial [Bacteroidales bacterium]|nr:uroporphyrinogen decarboxylase [Bacteroidales bacterium]
MDYRELKVRMKNIKSELDPSERSKRYFAGEEVDHIPYSLMLGNEVLCEIYGYKTSEAMADFNIYAEIIERKKEDFGINQVRIGLGLRTLGAAMGSTLTYPEHGIDRIQEYVLQDYNDWGKMGKAVPYNNRVLT